MSYRSDRQALESRREDLARQVTLAREALQRSKELADREAALNAELREVEALLRRGDDPVVLEDLRIASPCPARWSDMVGDDRVRFCGQCQKNVYDISRLTRHEAEALVRDREGSLCVRLARRADGTVLTKDCPVGLRRLRFRRAGLALAGLGLLAGATWATMSARMGAIERTQGELLHTQGGI